MKSSDKILIIAMNFNCKFYFLLEFRGGLCLIDSSKSFAVIAFNNYKIDEQTLKRYCFLYCTSSEVTENQLKLFIAS